MPHYLSLSRNLVGDTAESGAVDPVSVIVYEAGTLRVQHVPIPINLTNISVGCSSANISSDHVLLQSFSSH